MRLTVAWISTCLIAKLIFNTPISWFVVLAPLIALISVLLIVVTALILAYLFILFSKILKKHDQE